VSTALAIIPDDQHDRRRYIGGQQSLRVPALNEGVIRHLYGAGMTVREIAAELGVSYRGLWFFMDRCGIERRKAAKRHQSGDRNSAWAGPRIGYKGAHSRVASVRGKPSFCERCGTSDPSKRYEWANLTRQYHDPFDYKRMCRSCHCKHDGLIRNLGAHAKAAQP